MRELVTFSALGLLLLACGGSEAPARAPDAEASPPVAVTAPATAEASPPSDAEVSPKEEPKAEVVAPQPQFTDGMSWAEAVKAVPQGAERANIDSETLGKPLQDFAVYEPCKPGTTKVKMKVAVWDGKAVGIDVVTSPKNEKLAACVKDRIKGLTWQAKVKSLNTVDYAL